MKQKEKTNEKPDSQKLEAELYECMNNWKRTQADFENYKKGESSRRQDVELRAKKDILQRLLPVLDSLERALQVSYDSNKDMSLGLSQIQSQLRSALALCGIQEIAPAEGESFNPALHEAIGEVEGVHAPPGTIVRVAEKGYRYSESVIRPARVLVAQYKEE
ncbi:MAG: nucleotide exchange factor GrpE [bacterium]|nr:nucleotide exchange factor GrpE [bacterium]